jgi:two-component system response regulator AtoC
MPHLDILIADDEPELRAGIRSQLSPRGFHIQEAHDGDTAWQILQHSSFDLVLLDVKMPGLGGLEVLQKIKSTKPATTVAIITAHANLRDAVKAIQDGAFDYIEKPLQPEKLDLLIDKALAARQLVEEVAFSSPRENNSNQSEIENPKDSFIGQAAPMQRIFRMIDRLAFVNTSVLILGENGTGKELVARAIHYNSPRKDRPFVAVNCGAIPENLVESELFGHEKGAFTGAQSRKIGRFQYASGGTLFLDEIGDLPLPMQVKLLRVLQEQKITPVGSNREVKVDVRIIAATNKNLEEMMQLGTFRQDLFYRLNVMPLYLPSLRDRKEDIPILVNHFIKKFNEKHHRNILGISPEALEKLKTYTWPGNIRELENSVEHAFVIETESQIGVSSLPPQILESIQDQAEGWNLPYKGPDKTGTIIGGPNEVRTELTLSLNYHEDKERFEREFIIQALKTNQGRINQTCENANIPKNTLLRKIRKYNITPKDYE